MEPKATKLAAILSQQQTQLSPQEEQAFQMWALANSVPQGNDYNMRGFYKASQIPDLAYTEQTNRPAMTALPNPNDGRIHFPDTFKLPNHNTFSTHSGYYDPKTMPQTPAWVGGPIGNTQGQAWTLRRPNGQVVQAEAPWFRGGLMRLGEE